MPVQNIDWAHPNMRDGNLTKYKQGKPDFWKKEHQIKVWAVEYQPIGFAVIHKQEALDYFADKQRIDIEVQRKKHLSDVTHRYYWELVSRNRKKPLHPGENDDFIPKVIRGKHYDSWTAIAEKIWDIKRDSICLENELYEPMRGWLEQYLNDKYKGYDIIAVDTSQERLDRALSRYGIVYEAANGVDIQIDVLGIARKNADIKLFFIEAKKTRLTLRDLGQLWAYCKLIDPEEAFLLSSAGLGSLSKLIISFAREDLLDYGSGKKIKKMRVGKWNVSKNTIDFGTLIPKI
ncbi:MAG: hypothetical protein ACLTTJ_03190 [Blautia sp.]